MSATAQLIELDDIYAAREVMAGRVHRTPLISSAYLGQQSGVRLYFKLELFQKTGSFKARGVLNKLYHLSSAEKQKGVVTLSAGNHAQALAWAATQAHIRSTVVMPATAVRSKVAATEGYGGEVVLTAGDLLQTCLQIQQERDLTLVHPFDDPMIIAGAGTVGLEILENLPDVDAVITPVGGGGLISGVATAIKTQKTHTRIIGVEPEGAAAMSRSLQKGQPVSLEQMHTVADGLAAPFAGQHTLAHVQAYVDDMLLVSDREIIDAMVLILERCKVVAEPAAAASLAALLSGKIDLPRGAKVVCILSGGNIDRQRLKELL
ncbi:MAG: pyridoxal-phosphate dependent enzyme [Chloroflexi bacterium]|nr:pyridoxal-phosphate dependent enzyme [Chloroflexota bacterium]